ncbi:MAG: ABC transporter ATP-binding protein [Acutalibacteraceae bacterium]|jgi:ABC-2 type transport system ATP-binding protein
MLKIDSFSKTYKGDKKAVNNLSLQVNAGEIFGFIGPNGAGKTTTIKALAGVLDFEQGEIYIDGFSIKEKPLECKKTMAYIPDNPDLYEYLTGVAYLNFIGDIFRIDRDEREKLIIHFADRFELTKDLGNLISSYSHGMKQKLAIISALIHSPKLLVLDEPFVGLDPKASFVFKTIMREICDTGGAVFFSTHVLDVAEKLCDRVAIIRNGELIACGNTAEVRGDHSLEEIFLELTENA